MPFQALHMGKSEAVNSTLQLTSSSPLSKFLAFAVIHVDYLTGSFLRFTAAVSIRASRHINDEA